MTEDKLISQLVLLSGMLEGEGLLSALEGNASVTDRDTGNVYITPSAKSKRLLTENMIAVLDCGGNQVGGVLPRSSEYLLHMAAYEARPDCGAVIHSHAPYLTAFALCGEDIEIRCSASFMLGYGKIPCMPYREPATPELGAGVGKYLRGHDIVLLANHGCLCVGKDIESAARMLSGAESAVKTWLLAKTAGEPVDIPQERIESLLNNHPFKRKNM